MKKPVIFSKRLRGWHFGLLNITLGLGHILVMFNGGSYLALEPHAAGDLEGTFVSFMGWSQTNLMLAMALGFPIGRTLAERYGNYRVYVTAFILFAAASYLCAISDSYLRFLWARILLGFSGGLTLLLGQEILLNEYPARLKVLGVSIWGVLTITPFTLAGSIGGWFADELNWRYFST